MSIKKPELEKIIDNLCKNKDREYKVFIKKIIYAMSEDNKWGRLSEVEELNHLLKKKKK